MYRPDRQASRQFNSIPAKEHKLRPYVSVLLLAAHNTLMAGNVTLRTDRFSITVRNNCVLHYAAS